MPQKISSYLRGAFYLLFGLAAASLALRLMLDDSAPAFAPWLTALAIAALWAVYCLLKRYEAALEKAFWPLLGAFLLVMMVVNIVTAGMLRFSPVFDLGSVYDGAIQWVETGSFQQYYDYYYYFPNNLGGMAFLALFFAPLHALGVKDYFMAASVVNSLVVIGSMLLVSLICKRQLGAGAGVCAMVLFGVSQPFWYMGAVFYTDSLSMLFPVLAYYLYLRWQDCESVRGRLVLAALMGLTALVGMLVKFTVVIMLIAIVIDSLLAWPAWPVRRTGAMAGICAAVAAVGMLCFNSLIYPAHLDREQAKVQNTPYLHWVMMGLKGDGGYNSADYEFTRSFAGQEVQNEALWGEICLRAEELGPDGLYKLFWKKTCKTFGSGTYNQSDFLDDDPVEPGALQDFLLYDSEGYPDYRDRCQVLHIAVLALLSASCLLSVKEALAGEEPIRGGMAAPLAVLGLMLFFSAWETSGRYITNYLPVIYLCALRGLDGGFCIIKNARQRDNSPQ